MLELIDAIKQYNDKVILDSGWAYFPPKTTVCLWGESGAGKSTLLNVLANMATLTKGSATYNDILIERFDKWCNYRRKIISYMPCGDTLLNSLTVKENILLGKTALVMPVEDMLKELNILPLIDKKTSELSSGEYKRVCFAKCMIADVKYYLLDEPTSNLDNESAELIRKYIYNCQGKVGIIIATHDRAIKCDSDMVYRIEDGKVYVEEF